MKQHVISRSSAEVEYKAMIHVAGELMWLTLLLSEMGLPSLSTSMLHCDSQFDLYIAFNPVFREMTNHIKIDCLFIREKVRNNKIELTYIRTEHPLVDLFTKSLGDNRIH